VAEWTIYEVTGLREDKADISKRRGVITGDAPWIYDQLPFSVRVIVCGEIECCVSGGLYNTQKKLNENGAKRIYGKSKGTLDRAHP
jgi:hypothetical protein